MTSPPSDVLLMMADYSFPRDLRIRRRVEFERVYQRRRSVADESLVVHACENSADHPRLGLTVARRFGTAPARARWKRTIREAFRLSRAELPAGVDLVVSPRRGARPDLGQARRSLIQLAQRAARKLARDRQ